MLAVYIRVSERELPPFLAVGLPSDTADDRFRSIARFLSGEFEDRATFF